MTPIQYNSPQSPKHIIPRFNTTLNVTFAIQAEEGGGLQAHPKKEKRGLGIRVMGEKGKGGEPIYHPGRISVQSTTQNKIPSPQPSCIKLIKKK